MTAPDVCVVVPTVREPECVRAYVENAREHGFDIDQLHFVLVTESFCDLDGMEAMLEDLGVAGAVFDEPRRESWLADQGAGNYADLIPEASHAQTSFGLCYLWADEFEYGVFIDDDTRPHPEVDFFGTHLDNLAFEGTVERVASDENWVNVLHGTDTDLYPRGYPYGAMDEMVETDEVEVGGVVASQGLWTDVPDLDAVRILMDGDLQGQAETRLDADAFGEPFVAARGNYLTVCSMNLAFRREVVPAFYQLPMDDNPWGVGRFDDIWSGVLLKRACDLVGGRILNGDPLCEHRKAPRSTFDDLAAEAPGLELNEHLWRVVDEVEPDGYVTRSGDSGAVAADGEVPDADDYAAVFRAMARALADGDFEEYRNGEFFNYVGDHMLDWLDCLDRLAEPRAVPADD